jgi:hypothetical protein
MFTRNLASFKATLARGGLASLAVLIVVLVSAPETSAMPMFSRKYKTSCSTCHLAFPALSPFGRVFKNNGYRWPNGEDLTIRKDEPVSIGSEEQKRVFPDAIWPSDIPGGVPVAIQGIGRFNYARNAAVRWNYEFPHELELFMAGTLGSHFSFFGEAELENEGNAVEVAFPMWLQYDASPMLHLRAGAVEPEPFRSGLRLTRNHYNTNSFRSRNGWRYRNEHFGFEAWGAIDGPNGRGGLSYRVGSVNGQGPFADLNPSKDVYAKVAYKFGGMGEGGGGTPGGGGDPKFYRDDSISIGAYMYDGVARASTGTVDEDFRVVGATAEAWLNRLRLESVFMVMRSEIPARIDRDSKAAYLQGAYVLYPWLVPIARYEWDDADVNLETVAPVKSLIAGVSTAPAANIRLTSEYKRALDRLNRSRRNDSFTLQVNFGF